MSMQSTATGQSVANNSEAIAAVLMALFSILPGCGFVFSLCAITLAISLLRTPGSHKGQSDWKSVATFTIVLAVLGALFNAIFVLSQM
jgi:hypothetical protein